MEEGESPSESSTQGNNQNHGQWKQQSGGTESSAMDQANSSLTNHTEEKVRGNPFKVH